MNSKKDADAMVTFGFTIMTVAVETCRNFMGVDQFTAEQAVLEIQREMRLRDIPDEEPVECDSVRQQERSRWG